MDDNILKEAIKLIRVFTASTGMEGLVIDNRGKTLFKIPTNNMECTICNYIQGNECEESHLFGAYQSQIYGGSYIFFCPIGLVHFASPIIINEEMVGALLGGHVLINPPDDLLYEEVGRYIEDITEVQKVIQSVDVMSAHKVQALSELMRVLAIQVSGGITESLKEQQKDYIMNQELFSYIQKIKTSGEEGGFAYPVKREKELLQLIVHGERDRVAELIDSLLMEIIYLSGNEFEQLKVRVLELLVLLSRAIIDNGGNLQEVLGYNYMYISQVQQFKFRDELLRWTTTILTRFMDCVFDLSKAKHAHVIHKVINYIKANYMNKLTLQDAAEHVNFTPQYLSKIIKEETKYTFKNYVNKVKIEKSKELLMEDDLPLSEIAYLLGYSDQSHFSKTFKQITGKNPTEYKNTIS
jgi:AraC-like DNA-binding protein/ligand-binding sensor protein